VSFGQSSNIAGVIRMISPNVRINDLQTGCFQNPEMARKLLQTLRPRQLNKKNPW
jgi:hypothetical protein